MLNSKHRRETMYAALRDCKHHDLIGCVFIEARQRGWTVIRMDNFIRTHLLDWLVNEQPDKKPMTPITIAALMDRYEANMHVIGSHP